jgi:hypothetical protein
MYYVTIQLRGGLWSRCEQFSPPTEIHSDIVRAAIKCAAAHGGTASLVSDGQGNRIANLLPDSGKMANKSMRGVAAV